MNKEGALERIGNMVNVLSVDIPDEIEVFEEKYYPKKDIEEASE